MSGVMEGSPKMGWINKYPNKTEVFYLFLDVPQTVINSY